MADKRHNIIRLLARLDIIRKKQDGFASEIEELKKVIHELAEREGLLTDHQKVASDMPPQDIKPPSDIPVPAARAQTVDPAQPTAIIPDFDSTTPPFQPLPKKSFAFQENLEKFIGENLINKIGIIITVLGVGIGAKYSIDNDLISPLTRIIIGYLAGLGLMAVGYKLKQNYSNYSAVLVSGALAILYFITFFAYSFYALIPVSLAFGLMALFTIFGVIAAINYNNQFIALLGLVGAYGVPFLLSSESGDVRILFSYIAIINIGILAIAIKRYWKPLLFATFAFTWMIFSFWLFDQYDEASEFTIALTFLTVFFVIFYLTFLINKLVLKEQFNRVDVGLILINSFLFFGFGYNLLEGHEQGQEFLGLFALINALIHFLVAFTIYKQKLADRNLFYLITGLVLVFITMAIPIELDGNWVTLLWTGEALLLFWIARTMNISFYEMLSYPLMILAFLSLTSDWTQSVNGSYFSATDDYVPPFFNITFLTSLLFAGAFGMINYIKYKYSYAENHLPGRVSDAMNFLIPGMLLVSLYFGFQTEIEVYWNQLYNSSELIIRDDGGTRSQTFNNSNLIPLKSIWLLIYTIIFFIILSFANLWKFKNASLAHLNIYANLIVIFLALTAGIATLTQLRLNYLDPAISENYNLSPFQLTIRYLTFALIGLLLFASYQYVKEKYFQPKSLWIFDIVLHISILVIASSELFHWMELAQSSQSDKIGLSILWGVYALLLIILGIWKKKKHLRIAAIVLFSGTLIKLFAYDISDLGTIAKTIVFVSLGVLLLVISFLYNKYKPASDD